ITGEVGNVTQDVISVSLEGVFVAVALGYAFEEDRAKPVEMNLGNEGKRLVDITLGDFPPDVLIEGFRIDPRFETAALTDNTLDPGLIVTETRNIFQRIKPPESFGFLLSIVDSATGRELQNEPVHSVATLGGANGRRPFKALSQPMVFMPRSTIRLQVEERTRNVTGRLYITLQGYKVLGVAGDVEGAVRNLLEMDPLRKVPVYNYQTGNYNSLGEAPARHAPTTGVVPFDYVSTLQLKGKPDNIEEDEILVNVDGGFVALAIGYSLDPQDTGLEIQLPAESANIDLKTIKLTDIKPARALFDGIRLDPLRLLLAFSAGRLTSVPRDTAGRMFQRLNLAGDVRFLYSIIDAGTGRELQNKLVHNVAGLGIANGDRPFRVLPKPMTFLPRSSIRVQVREISGRGRLFIVFQGYKKVA
ncbi:MAG TPA: hypothetical protein VF088_04995, partial [Pyrinomonadaceae bacterium]